VLEANGAVLEISQAGAYPVIEHDRHTEGVIEVSVGTGLQCLATCFTPGVA
jgi:hypothetical protein